MAGRGTDIVLGGSWQEKLPRWKIRPQSKLKKLKPTAGTSRCGTGSRWPAYHRYRAHESRRIDNQLRGRSGRQGDVVLPVSTCRWKMR